MATKAVIYQNSKGDTFLKLEGHNKNHQYSVKFLEKLTGFKLSEYASLWLYKSYKKFRGIL